MAKKGGGDFFWPSYVDLMTNLFAIMLVLFVVSFFLFSKRNSDYKKANDRLIVQQQQYERILQLQNQFKSLSNNDLLRYDENNRIFVVHSLEGKELFDSLKSTIVDRYSTLVSNVGKELDSMLKAINDDPNSKQFNYLLVIEGYSANKINKTTGEMNWEPDREYNYRLSYDRALALYNHWREVDSIDLRKYPNVEVQICGSGLNGIHRDMKTEPNNKRFIIQIIPRVAKIHTDDTNLP